MRGICPGIVGVVWWDAGVLGEGSVREASVRGSAALSAAPKGIR
jgi:hypothetical protein